MSKNHYFLDEKCEVLSRETLFHWIGLVIYARSYSVKQNCPLFRRIGPHVSLISRTFSKTQRTWSLFCKYCIRPWIVFHNITSEYNSTFVFFVLWLQFGILQMTDVHQWGNMNFCTLRPCFIDHLWFTSDLSGLTPESFQVSPNIYPLLLLLRVFSLFWCIGINLLCQIVMLLWVNCHLFLRYGPHDELVEILSYAIVWIHWLPRPLVLLRVSPCLLFLHVLQGMAGAIGVSNFFRSFLMVSLNSLSSGSMR